MKVVVTGSRETLQRNAITRFLRSLHKRRPIALLATGGCPNSLDRTTNEWVDSTDMVAERWAWEAGLQIARFPANWDGQGKGAGPRRNGSMLRALMPDLVLVFPGGAGTKDCARQAEALGLETHIVELEDTPNA